MMMKNLILASGSPRRKELLSLYTTDFTICVSDFDESGVTAPTPAQLVEKLARGKCLAVAKDHPGAVVLDEPLTVQPMQRVLVPTGLAIELPGAHAVALVYARSGLSIKHGLCMANGVGVVDSDYRGELKVPMVNLGAEAYTIQPGERVAQLCIAPVYTAAFVQADALDETARGEGGFGSTGK